MPCSDIPLATIPNCAVSLGVGMESQACQWNRALSTYLQLLLVWFPMHHSWSFCGIHFFVDGTHLKWSKNNSIRVALDAQLGATDPRPGLPFPVGCGGCKTHEHYLFLQLKGFLFSTFYSSFLVFSCIISRVYNWGEAGTDQFTLSRLY